MFMKKNLNKTMDIISKKLILYSRNFNMSPEDAQPFQRSLINRRLRSS